VLRHLAGKSDKRDEPSSDKESLIGRLKLVLSALKANAGKTACPCLCPSALQSESAVYCFLSLNPSCALIRLLIECCRPAHTSVRVEGCDRKVEGLRSESVGPSLLPRSCPAAPQGDGRRTIQRW
jgi:hypothetical protein